MGTINRPENRMTNTSRVCPKCGATVFADAPQGCCSVCLVRTGLASLDDENDKASEPTVARMLKDFGDYELLQEIGHGGQGVVYRARQKSLNRIVALKVIGLAHWATEAHIKRFRLEAEAAASLNHPYIVPIYEVGERDGACYFSMGLVEGGQLDAVAKRETIPIRHAAELIAKLARTVSYAHEHGILHRDIKPGNILLDAKGEPHLTDFGLARLVETESTVTRTLEVLGTPSYMAPEQAVGNNAAVTAETDVYGLGAVFYQLLTGHPPFAGGTTYETIKLLLDTEPRQPRLWNPKIDRDLSTICLKCLEKDPKRRYSSALALAEDLERWLRHEPISARRTGLVTRSRKWVQRNPTSALLAASLVALAAAAGWIVWKTEFIPHPVTTGIAVLPFENLSDDKEHAFFADGIQDDILTKLAKVADLKVISRTSVMPYRGARNTHQIGNALLVSYDLYVQAASLIDKAAYEERTEQGKDYFQATEFLNQAIARDPAFLLAYCRLAEANNELYFQSFDRTPSRLELAKSAINSAFRLKPDSGEAHLALATHLYHGYFDYNHARDELAIAVRTLPNNARIFEWSAYIDRRQSRWRDAVRDFGHAMELDPRNVKILIGAVITYESMREYKRAREVADRIVALEPNNIVHRRGRAHIDLRERADTRPLHAFDKMLADDPEGCFYLALYERDAVAADQALAALRALGEDTFDAGGGEMTFSRAYLEGLVARMKGDAAAAQAAFTVARAHQEEAVRARPDHGPFLCVLGLIDAALGRKEEALREGRRALELAPTAKDYLDGVDVLYYYAVICAWTDEHDLAIEQLETLAKIPSRVSYGDIRLNPNWDPLRGDPRFEKIVEEAKQPVALK